MFIFVSSIFKYIDLLSKLVKRKHLHKHFQLVRLSGLVPRAIEGAIEDAI